MSESPQEGLKGRKRKGPQLYRNTYVPFMRNLAKARGWNPDHLTAGQYDELQTKYNALNDIPIERWKDA